MSDMEDDFMCDDEEDYDLVFKTESNIACFSTFKCFCPKRTYWSAKRAGLSC